MLCAAVGVAAVATAGNGVWGPSHGPKPGPVVALAIHPRNPLIVYAGTPHVWEGGQTKSRGALYRSTNGGRRWIKTPLEGVLAVVVDPRHSETVYVSTQYEGVFKSLDGGRTWRTVSTGLGDLTVARLAIDPKRPETVYAGTGSDYGDGVFKSTDGGRRWRASGLADYFVDAVAIDPRTPTTLYAAIWDPQFANDPENRLVKSTDGGRSWVEQEPGLRSIGSLAINPITAATVYAGTSRGVFKSTDGGRRWRAAGLAKLGGVAALVVDPRRPATLYAATWRAGVFKSTNGGRSWSRFSRGLTTLSVSALAVDSSGRVLYAGTDAGVFDYRHPG